MLTVEIPGREALTLHHLILDYNGTIATDGKILPGVKDRLRVLRDKLSIYVITADTHGTAAKECADIPVKVLSFPTEHVGKIKEKEAAKLCGGVVCIGNGWNDVQMADVCDLSVCVIGQEGCCGQLLSHCDIVVTSIEDGLDLLIKTDRIRATLRT